MKSKWLLFAMSCASLQFAEAAQQPSVQPYAPPAPIETPAPFEPSAPIETPAPFEPPAPIEPPEPEEPPPTAWFTGPLIAPIGAVVPYGHFEIESYVYFTTNIGTYNQQWDVFSAPHNFFSLNPQFLCFFGLTSWMDLNIIPMFFYNTTNGQSSVNFGDLPVALDFQLLDPNYTPYFPGIKLIVQETFPTGPFQNLNPTKLKTDQTGTGAFATTFNLVLYKVYHLGGCIFLSTTYSAAYTLNTPVHVRGFNNYGGGFGTHGWALPGNIFKGIISFELSLSRNWALAIDNVYLHTDRTRFFGEHGTTVSGEPASVGSPSSEQISFAPAIEYNFSSNFGIEAGCWFTGWGRNSTEFRSAVINIAYTY